MSDEDWRRLELLAERLGSQEPTSARAYGSALSYLLSTVPAEDPASRPLDWLDWERRKVQQTLRLLRPGA